MDQYGGSQSSSAGPRKRAVRDKVALRRNVCFLLMGMGCENAFIFAFTPSQRISSSQSKVGITHTPGNTWAALSPVSHEQPDLQTSHFPGSYSRI